MTTKHSWQEYLQQCGFNPNDAPFSPIKPEWASFPIIRCIRDWEKQTDKHYINKEPQL